MAHHQDDDAARRRRAAARLTVSGNRARVKNRVATRHHLRARFEDSERRGARRLLDLIEREALARANKPWPNH